MNLRYGRPVARKSVADLEPSAVPHGATRAQAPDAPCLGRPSSGLSSVLSLTSGAAHIGRYWEQWLSTARA
jgi:hypothetical protein